MILPIVLALGLGYVAGYAAKCRRARAEGFLAGRLFERLALRHAIDELSARRGE